jgi:hypothetical protein
MQFITFAKILKVLIINSVLLLKKLEISYVNHKLLVEYYRKHNLVETPFYKVNLHHKKASFNLIKQCFYFIFKINKTIIYTEKQ